jgi:putative spermidine/putrescine transport system substrate-binding protein
MHQYGRDTGADSTGGSLRDRDARARSRRRPPASPLGWSRRPRLLLGVSGALAALMLALGVSACGSSSHSTALVIGGWGGIIDEATQKSYLNEFDAANHATSQFVDAPGEQLARVEAQNRAGKVEWTDVDSLDAGSAFTLYAKHELLTLPTAMQETLKRELGAAKVTPFGFSHGSLGDVIVCNMDKMTSCPTTMAQFYNTTLYPQPRMFGGIEPIVASTTAEVAAGMPISQTATTPLDVPAVIKTLEKVRPKIKVFWQNGDQQQQIMRSGEADMGIMWSDRAYQLIAQGMHLKLNWLGGAYEPSYWAVLKGAPHTEEGLKLLSWIASHPRGEAKWAEAIHDSVPNPIALSYLPKSINLQLADNPVNLSRLAVPNFNWYAQHGAELNTAYENFLRG